MNKRFVRTLSRAVDNIVLLALLVCLIFATYSLWDTHQFYDNAGAEKYATYKPVDEEGKKSFEELRAMNPDTMGWLTIYGTSIDYPIVKAQKSNLEYLSKSIEGEWESSGALYVDVNNSWNFADFNTIIHGHHMAEHKMFGDLDLFTDSNFFQSHQYANLYYEGENHGVEIFAVLTIDAYNPIVHSTGLTTDEAKQEFLDRIQSQKLLSRNMEINYDDHLVTMTTCNLTETNGRFTLVGKILDHEVADPFYVEEKENPIFNIDVFSLLDKAFKLPVYLWILILLLLILLTWCLYRLERRRLLNRRRRNEKKKAEMTYGAEERL